MRSFKMKKSGKLVSCLMLVELTTGLTSCRSDQGSETLSSSLGAATSFNEQDKQACKQAQALIGGYDLAKIQDHLEVEVLDDLGSFLKSKPAITNDLVALKSYRPDPVQRLSEYSGLWCKLKSRQALEANQELPSFPSAQQGVNCDGVQKSFFSALLATDQVTRELYDSSGYHLVFSNQVLRTGGQWAPSSLTVKLKNSHDVEITTTSLESPLGIPVIGGMNYCKLLAADGLQKLVRDLHAKNFDFVSLDERLNADEWLPSDIELAEVEFNPRLGNALAQKASLFYPASSSQIAGIYIMSPGGGIPPLTMRGIAQGLVRRGYLTFIVHYPNNLAILEKISGSNNSAINLAKIIRAKGEREITGLPSKFQNLSSMRILAFGHSLGGAILGEALFGSDNPFDSIVTYGTTSYVDAKKRPLAAKSYFSFLGEADGLSLSDATRLPTYLAQYGFQKDLGAGRYQIPDQQNYVEIIPKLSHFCIVSDLSIDGFGKKKAAEDRTGPPPRECLKTLLDKLDERGL